MTNVKKDTAKSHNDSRAHDTRKANPNLHLLQLQFDGSRPSKPISNPSKIKAFLLLLTIRQKHRQINIRQRSNKHLANWKWLPRNQTTWVRRMSNSINFNKYFFPTCNFMINLFCCIGTVRQESWERMGWLKLPRNQCLKNLILNFFPCVPFLSVADPMNCDADGIYESIMKKCLENNLDLSGC